MFSFLYDIYNMILLHFTVLRCEATFSLVGLCVQELFGGYDGVDVVVSYLKGDTGKFESGLGHSRLFLAATDCVWCTVVGNPVVEDIFLENAGVFILLDLLKVLGAVVLLSSLFMGVG